MRTKTKPQLHQSHLFMLGRCGYQFYRVVICGDKEPPAVPAIIGKAAHKTTEISYLSKIKKEQTNTEMIKDLAADCFESEWNTSPVMFSKDEIELGIDKVKGNSKDRTIGMCLAHHNEILPNVNPAPDGVEWKWVIECDGYPYDLAGQMDVREADQSVRDSKFRGKRVSQGEVDASEQLTLYSMAVFIITGVMPPKVWLDGVSAGKQSVSTSSLCSTRTQEDFTVFKNRFENAIEVIDKQAYTPANATDWWCSDRFCGFAADGSCPYYNSGRKRYTPTRRENAFRLSSSTRKIEKNTEEWTNAVR